MNTLPLFLDRVFYAEGATSFVEWLPTRRPMMLVMGKTGSGKSYFVRSLIARMGLRQPSAQVTICNYKISEDFSFLAGSPRYFEFESCLDGINSFYSVLQDRLKGNPDRTPQYLVFDEYSAFLNNLDKKAAEDVKKKMGNILAVGRSLCCFCIVSLQRGDAEYFNANRFNFSVVVMLGPPDKSMVEMFFSDYKEQIKPIHTVGEGYALLDGIGLKSIKVARIKDDEKVRFYMRRAVSE